MRTPLAVALASLLAASTGAAAPRVDARLRAVAEGRVAAGLFGPGGRARVAVSGAPEALLRLGGRPERVTAGLAYLDVAAGDLAALARLPGVTAIEPSRRLWPLLDRSAPACRAPEARASSSVDGRGVVVGVVDTGADIRHMDLRAADGTTRIAALLDRAAGRDDRHPELPDYGGAVWLREEIDALLAAEAGGARPPVPISQRDRNGHGTHVAGIAAGSGLAAAAGFPSGRYVGVAPGATLVVAQASNGAGSFEESDVLASTRFIFDRAASLGMPAVVNLSLGGSGGPHDGTTSLERGLAEIVPLDAAGRALVVAAGNLGARDQHVGGWRIEGGEEIAIDVPLLATSGTRLSIDLWYDAGGAGPAITLVAPDGEAHGPIDPGGSRDFGEQARGQVVIGNDAATDPFNGRRQAFVDVRAVGEGPIRTGRWRLLLDGRVGRWDGWMVVGDPSSPTPRFADHLAVDNGVVFPATCPSAIAVGAVVNRADWTTQDGRPITRNLVPGQPSTFSSTGPSLDGRFVPDLVAPGEFVVAALSRDAPPDSPASAFNVPGEPGYLWADDGVHGLLRGTSQAAPHVTGTIALLLQADPRLTGRRLREILRSSTKVAAGEAGWSTRSGFGRLDAAAALRLLARASTGSVDPAASTVGVNRDLVPPGRTATVTVTPRDAAGAPLGPGRSVDVFADGGEWTGDVVDLGDGRYERQLRATGSGLDAATVAAVVDGVTLGSHPRVFMSWGRGDIGRPRLAGRGCSLGGGPARADGLLPLSAVILVGCVLARRGRRR